MIVRSVSDRIYYRESGQYNIEPTTIKYGTVDTDLFTTSLTIENGELGSIFTFNYLRDSDGIMRSEYKTSSGKGPYIESVTKSSNTHIIHCKIVDKRRIVVVVSCSALLDNGILPMSSKTLYSYTLLGILFDNVSITNDGEFLSLPFGYKETTIPFSYILPKMKLVNEKGNTYSCVLSIKNFNNPKEDTSEYEKKFLSVDGYSTLETFESSPEIRIVYMDPCSVYIDNKRLRIIITTLSPYSDVLYVLRFGVNVSIIQSLPRPLPNNDYCNNPIINLLEDLDVEGSYVSKATFNVKDNCIHPRLSPVIIENGTSIDLDNIDLSVVVIENIDTQLLEVEVVPALLLLLILSTLVMKEVNTDWLLRRNYEELSAAVLCSKYNQFARALDEVSSRYGRYILW